MTQISEDAIEPSNRWPSRNSRRWVGKPPTAEAAFYDALAANESTVAVLGDETLKLIAHELVDKVRRSATVDWPGARAPGPSSASW